MHLLLRRNSVRNSREITVKVRYRHHLHVKARATVSQITLFVIRKGRKNVTARRVHTWNFRKAAKIVNEDDVNYRTLIKISVWIA